VPAPDTSADPEDGCHLNLWLILVRASGASVVVAFGKQQTALGAERRALILMSRVVFSKERSVTQEAVYHGTDKRPTLAANHRRPKVVGERLRHASITITLDAYSHVLPGMQQAPSDKLASLFFARKKKDALKVAHYEHTQTAGASRRGRPGCLYLLMEPRRIELLTS